MPSSHSACGRRWLGALAMILAWPLSLGAGFTPAAPSHCEANELIVFSCRITSGRVVSICARRQNNATETLAYRFGAPGHVELDYMANIVNGNRFFATVSPLSPGASVRQVWFMRGEIKYLLTECVGGDCPEVGGLAVFRGDDLLSERRCLRTADDHAWFSREVVNFGADSANSQSLTNLLQFDDVDNAVERLYPLRAWRSSMP